MARTKATTKATTKAAPATANVNAPAKTVQQPAPAWLAKQQAAAKAALPTLGTAPANGLAQLVAIANVNKPVAPLAGKAASQAILQAAVANGTAANGATARAHTWGQHGQSVGNTAKLPAGSLSVTSKGAAYTPKPGYNANAWQAVQAAINAGPCNATQAAQAIGHAGAAWVRYAVQSGWLVATV
jgi:hypothetical protein